MEFISSCESPCVHDGTSSLLAMELSLANSLTPGTSKKIVQNETKRNKKKTKTNESSLFIFNSMYINGRQKRNKNDT